MVFAASAASPRACSVYVERHPARASSCCAVRHLPVRLHRGGHGLRAAGAPRGLSAWSIPRRQPAGGGPRHGRPSFWRAHPSLRSAPEAGAQVLGRRQPRAAGPAAAKPSCGPAPRPGPRREGMSAASPRTKPRRRRGPGDGQAIPVAGGVERGHRLGVDAELGPREDLEGLLERAEAAGQREEPSASAAMVALRSCMLSTNFSSVRPVWASSRLASGRGITPMTSTPAAMAASARIPMMPTEPPP